MRPLGIKNYGSIPHLSSSKLGPGDHYITAGQERILTEKKRDKHDEIFVFEKYDGSNVGVCKVEGKIHAITRSGHTAIDSKYSQHNDFHCWVKRNEYRFQEYLREGERICGEWIAKPHSIVYTYDEPVLFFDAFDKYNNRLSVDDFYWLAFHKMELRTARILYRGDSIGVSHLKEELEEGTLWAYGNEEPEGMVYRVERKGIFDFAAKWVRHDFEPGKLLIHVNNP